MKDLLKQIDHGTRSLYNGVSLGTTWRPSSGWVVKDGDLTQISEESELYFQGFRLPNRFEIIFHIAPPFADKLFVRLTNLTRLIVITLTELMIDPPSSPIFLLVRVSERFVEYRLDTVWDDEAATGASGRVAIERVAGHDLGELSFQFQGGQPQSAVVARLRGVYIQELEHIATPDQFRTGLLEGAPLRKAYFDTLLQSSRIAGGGSCELDMFSDHSRRAGVRWTSSSLEYLGSDRLASYSRVSGLLNNGIAYFALIAMPKSGAVHSTIILPPPDYFPEMVLFSSIGQYQNVARFFLERQSNLFVPYLATTTPALPRNYAISINSLNTLKATLLKEGRPLFRTEIDLTAGLFAETGKLVDGWKPMKYAVGWCATNWAVAELRLLFPTMTAGLMLSAGGLLQRVSVERRTFDFSKFAAIPIQAQFGNRDMDYPVAGVLTDLQDLVRSGYDLGLLEPCQFKGFHEFDPYCAAVFLDRMETLT